MVSFTNINCEMVFVKSVHGGTCKLTGGSELWLHGVMVQSQQHPTKIGKNLKRQIGFSTSKRALLQSDLG